MANRDRKSLLEQSTAWNGIDFVEVADAAQTALRVHFLNGVTLAAPVPVPVITGGESIPTVLVQTMTWGTDAAHLVLNLTVAVPGDFTQYTLSISSANLDAFFSSTTFSFKDGCPSALDCRPAAAVCAGAEGDVPPIDYLTKDFAGFRQALLDFSSLRYPQWQERSEADFGVVFAEALAAVADDLSYTQDRIAAEAVLENVTQRRSLTRLARMVDYEPGRATGAVVLLQFDVAAGVQSVAHGLAVSASGPDGAPVVFETGNGLVEVLIDPATRQRRTSPPTSVANPLWNSGQIQPYWLDDSRQCLAAGAVSMNVLGRGFGFQPGQQLLIDTQGATGADPPVRQIVQLVAVGPAVELSDPLFLSTPSASGPPWTTPDASPAGTPAPTSYTQITWQASDAITVARDLSVTTVCGNIVPATQGQRAAVEMFAIAGPAGGVPAAIVRTGPRSLPDEPGDAPPDPVPQHLYCLSNPSRLTWLGAASAASAATPEILVEQASGDVPPPWSWVLSILDAGPFDHSFTLDEARYQSIAVNSDGSTQFEYAGDVGDTIRFGTGTFGEIPDDGTVFQVTYRVGGGASGNVAAGAISQLADSAVAAGLIAVTNPLAASGGNDAETAQSVQRLAPQTFRAVQYRAVIPADYQAAAETLPWVQRAGTVFRWTGSWLTVLTTPDPMGSEGVTVPQQTELIDLLNRYRMAGYESYVPAAQYVSLDLELQIWAGADAFRGDVQTAVLARLNASGRVNGVAGFFDPDHFTFGTPLERSRLESRVQSAPGVAGVGSILFRVRNRTQGFTPMPDQVTVGGNQIIRCDNDPSEPEHGSIQITILGGK